MVTMHNELSNFLIDTTDEDCPGRALHIAAYSPNDHELALLLDVPELRKEINTRIKPFLATPLRLAATAGVETNVKILIESGANVDLVDVKAQTPLFVALINQHWGCARLLLKNGANPNGSEMNLCTPLAVMAQRGFYEGIRLLCEYGAEMEDLYRLQSSMPGLPLAITATYHHFKCFATLLLFGAKTGIAHLSSHLSSTLPAFVSSQCSVPHAMVKANCLAEFIYLFRELGGTFFIRDSEQRLAADLYDNLAANVMKRLQEQPLSLQSACRVTIRRHLTLQQLSMLMNAEQMLSKRICDFLQYKELFLSSNQGLLYEYKAVCNIQRVINEIFDDGPVNSTKYFIPPKRTDTLDSNLVKPNEPKPSTLVTSMPPRPRASVTPLPPPPPPPPSLPRPGIWRFPEAEFSDRGIAR